ncbi:ROK family protein [Ereboglobus luteus]|uniref:Transcriptional regulator n=1 Tax=Ereboglobus luteus TaxID=1796921 RepID=A0A2U8E5E9_9BACT|nr:ROK family protein [Ereboglobus luteus]AWI10077.1 transcriptional regulator [Ereboglobus luteus]
MTDIRPKITPPLDPAFVPASLWTRAYGRLVANDNGARDVEITLVRGDGGRTTHRTRALAAGHPRAALTLRHIERMIKFLLWQRGGCRVLIAGADELVEPLKRIYGAQGERAFDCEMMGAKIYGNPFEVARADESNAASAFESQDELSVGGHLDGCRIGFDLGGSDRKVAALIDGRVVFSEEIPWSPYFEKDPSYHIDGVQDLLVRAAAHLPRVDAIGGSSAGVYVNNEVRVASLFRNITPELFEKKIRRMFPDLRERWGGVPFEVVNDGEVTALAGSMFMKDNAVLGVSMGTSQAGGYVTTKGGITPWLNELAFVPVDYREDAPRDEWSGDGGCGVQYFSQQGVARLARAAGFGFPETMPMPEQLEAVQEAMKKADPRARAIYETVGDCFGYSLAHYADFYELRNILILGRVTSGEGGRVIIDRARAVLDAEFPELSSRLALRTPGEQEKRHGQAIAAASLPAITDMQK